MLIQHIFTFFCDIHSLVLDKKGRDHNDQCQEVKEGVDLPECIGLKKVQVEGNHDGNHKKTHNQHAVVKKEPNSKIPSVISDGLP